MSAWNYPIYTAIPQVAAGIVAGNSVILKPSELAPHTSLVLEKLFDKYLDKSISNNNIDRILQVYSRTSKCCQKIIYASFRFDLLYGLNSNRKTSGH